MTDNPFERYANREDYPFLLEVQGQMKREFYRLAAEQIKRGRDPEAVYRGLIDASMTGALELHPTPAINTAVYLACSGKSMIKALCKVSAQKGLHPTDIRLGTPYSMEVKH